MSIIFKRSTDTDNKPLSDPQLNQTVFLHYEHMESKNPIVYEALIEDVQRNTYNNPLTGKTEIVTKLTLQVQKEKEA